MDIKDVENLAELARLELTPQEKKDILEDMKGILKYVDQIEAIKLPENTGEEVGEVQNVWREDVAEPRDFSKDIIAGQFPDSKDGFLKVKKIL